MQSALWGRNPDDWASIQEVTSHPGYEYVLDQLNFQSGDHLLDIGCGSGYFCSMAQARLDSAEPPSTPANNGQHPITGFDATEPLIEQARRRTPGIKFLTGDMEALPFGDASFDIVTGFNSFQYAANISAAFNEARRVLKPGGRFVVMIWGNKTDCEAATYLAAIGSLLPPPPPGAPGPFALSEAKRLEQLLTDTGFNVTSSYDVPTLWDYPDMDTALKGLLSAGPATRAIDHSGYQKVVDTLRAAAQPFSTNNGHIVYHNTFRVVMSTKTI
jgi:SAM-dependent methyltransferase